jgi:hypothetical protein
MNMNKKAMNKVKEKLQSEDYLESVTIKEYEGYGKVRIRDRLAWTCVGIIIFSILATYTIIVLAGIGLLPHLPKEFLKWLGVATIGTIITSVLIVYKSMFQTKESKDSSGKKEESNEDQ